MNERMGLKNFLKLEAMGAIVLFVATFMALILANTPLKGSYEVFWHCSLGGMSLRHWLNDGLMTVFFLVVGLEIKREITQGELSSKKKAALPIAAALGGMIVPALVYTAFNFGKLSITGWGIPMATDIAFALGALALLGRRVQASLKVFLTAFAIVDDIGAVLVVAIFYTVSICWFSLGIGIGLFFVLLTLNRMKIDKCWLYLAIGVLLWASFLKSGIHPTIAGILLAFVIPSHLGTKIEAGLHPWVSFGIMPLFAFGNAGVSFSGGTPFNSVSLGIMAGLIFGKPLGISLFSWIAIRLKLAALPEQLSWRHLYGAACLGGIGFTMSLFISNLAFGENSLMIDAAKIAILLASVISGFIGVGGLFLVLRLTLRGRSISAGG